MQIGDDVGAQQGEAGVEMSEDCEVVAVVVDGEVMDKMGKTLWHLL